MFFLNTEINSDTFTKENILKKIYLIGSLMDHLKYCKLDKCKCSNLKATLYDNMN